MVCSRRLQSITLSLQYRRRCAKGNRRHASAQRHVHVSTRLKKATRPDAGLTLPHKQMIGTNHCIEPPDAVFILDTNGAIILETNEAPCLREGRRTTEQKKRGRRQTCLRMPASCSRGRITETHWKQMMGVIPDILQRRTSQSTAKCRFKQRTSELSITSPTTAWEPWC